MKHLASLADVLNPPKDGPPPAPCQKCKTLLSFIWYGGKWEHGICPACMKAKANDDFITAQKIARENKINELLATSPIGAEFKDATFDNFDIINEDHRRSIEAVRRFASLICQGQENSWIILAGSFGTGKTRLLEATYKYLVQNNKTPAYFEGGALIDKLRSLSKTKTGKWDFINELLKSDLLMLDDIDESLTTAHDYLKAGFVDVLDAFYRAAKPMIMATNSKWKDLAKSFGPKLEDRIFHRAQGNYHKFKWESYRRR